MISGCPGPIFHGPLKISLFDPLSCSQKFSSVLPFLRVFSLNFDRAAGAQDGQRTPNVHLTRAPVLQTPPTIPREDPQREKQTAKCLGEKEKCAKFGFSPPFGPTTFLTPTFLGTSSGHRALPLGPHLEWPIWT